MFAQPTLLAAYEDTSGPFVKWLEELGLGEFLKQYPLSKLVEWGWVIPQYRVPFPKRFFECWENYPCFPCDTPTDLIDYATLWGYWWEIDDSSEPLWFLDPIFQPGNQAGQLLKQHPYKASDKNPIPESFEHKRGISITPYVDYFYKWQGYALIDVIAKSDIFEPIYFSPDAIDRANSLARLVERINDYHPKTEIPNYWTELDSLMVNIQHLQGLQRAIPNTSGSDFHKNQTLYQEGARALAIHFEITPDNLEQTIREHLLVLAQNWMMSLSPPKRKSILISHAWPNLQLDIQKAISWLIILSGKSFEDYIEEWNVGFMGWRPEAAIDKVLPFEFLEHKRKFTLLAPTYLKKFNETNSSLGKFDEETLPKIIRNLCKLNYPFTGFLSAFYELHEHLTYKSFEKNGLDFRTLRPLDHYALLAIHAEGCLRRELDSMSQLDNINSDHQGLSVYIQKLAELKKLSGKISGSFNNHRKLADLRTNRNDPIGRIQSLKTNLSATEHQVVQAFLCCLLARNYFAHHDFLDKELIRSEKSAFMLKGILLTVLILLNV